MEPTNPSLTLGSLFDGIGGWQLAAVRNGIKPVWSSEIEPYPMAVTRHHFPNTIQLGDITKLKGENLPPVDIICAGSPCQDLSVAGRQKGLSGERSGLFYQSVQLFYAMRRKTNGKYPRYFIWENVLGAFSSNSGQDFRAVLEEIGQTRLPMPDRKWAKAGLVELSGCQIAWRVLDAQYWGVPQRRARIFLVADFGSAHRRAADLLFIESGMQGNPRTCQETERETASRSIEGSSHPTSSNPDLNPAYCISGNIINRKTENGGHHLGVDTDVAFTLNTIDRHAVYADTYVSRRNVCSQQKGKLASGKGCTGALCANASTKRWGGNQKAFSGDYYILEGDITEESRTVRRLTVTECERLQGLPDGWTDVPWNNHPARDSERIKAIGNGMAQPCADFVLRQLAFCHQQDSCGKMATS